MSHLTKGALCKPSREKSESRCRDRHARRITYESAVSLTLEEGPGDRQVSVGTFFNQNGGPLDGLDMKAEDSQRPQSRLWFKLQREHRRHLLTWARQG